MPTNTTGARGAMRTHVVLPRELVEAVDEVAGRRGRSRFFAEAAEEKLTRIKLARVAQKVVGSLEGVEVPGWETTESAAEWVRASRRADDARLSRGSRS